MGREAGMADEGVSKADFAHGVGTFHLAKKTGTIDYVTPVHTATASLDMEDGRIHLVGQTETGQKLFDIPVNPQRNSCAPHAEEGTFEEFVPVSPDLRRIILYVDGSEAAEFSRGKAAGQRGITLGVSDKMPNKLSLDAQAAQAPGVTYKVQAKPAERNIWQTLAVGLPTPVTEVDVNQFPGSKSIEIRVLRSDGFSEAEIFKETKKF